MLTSLIALACGTPTPEATPEGSGRDCYDRATPTPLEPGTVGVGSFTQVRATEDHAYGHAIDLMRTGDRCSGLLLHYDGDIEPRWSVLQAVVCKPDGSVKFTVSSEWWLGYDDIGPFTHPVRFVGKLTGERLEGVLTSAGERTPFSAEAQPVLVDMRWETQSALSAADRCVGDGVRTH